MNHSSKFPDTNVVTWTVFCKWIWGAKPPFNTPGTTPEITRSPWSPYYVAHGIAAWALSYMQMGRNQRRAWSSSNKLEQAWQIAWMKEPNEVSIYELPLTGEDSRRVAEIICKCFRVPSVKADLKMIAMTWDHSRLSTSRGLMQLLHGASASQTWIRTWSITLKDETQHTILRCLRTDNLRYRTGKCSRLIRLLCFHVTQGGHHLLISVNCNAPSMWTFETFDFSYFRTRHRPRDCDVQRSWFFSLLVPDPTLLNLVCK